MNKKWVALLAAGWMAATFSADAGDVKSVNPWVREAPPTAQVLAAYLTLENSGSTPRNVVGIVSRDFAKVEIHRTVNHNGMMMMEAIPALTIPPQGNVVLAPGGFHLMLIGAQRPLRAGEMVPMTLQLDNGEQLELQAEVKKVEPTAPAAGMEHHHHEGH